MPFWDAESLKTCKVLRLSVDYYTCSGGARRLNQVTQEGGDRLRHCACGDVAGA